MKQKFLAALLIATSITGIGFAQQATDIMNTDVSYMPGSYIPIPAKKTYFDYRPTQRVEIQTDNTPQAQEPAPPKPYAPVLGQDGSFIFPYGATLPSIICAPLHLCEVSLQPGETIQQIDVGDTLRWQVKLARSLRDGVEISHLIIKPSETGIVSNIVAITDKRTYTMQLVSKRDRSWMPKVSFSYPDDIQANWKAYFAQNEQNTSRTMLVSNASHAPILDFKYKIKGGKPSWRPTQIYSDHAKTYIQLPARAQNTEIPVLVIIGPDSTEQLVNYRLDGDRFVVDKVIEKASLVSGVGRHQEKVEIVHTGRY